MKGYSAQEAAEMLGITDNAVRRKVREGELAGEKIGSRLVVHHDNCFDNELVKRRNFLKLVGSETEISAPNSGRPSSAIALAKEISELRKEVKDLKKLIQSLIRSSPSKKR